MTVWQHAWISLDPLKQDDIAKLERFGQDGWELVSVMPWGTPGSNVFLMFFKRPRPDEVPGIGG